MNVILEIRIKKLVIPKSFMDWKSRKFKLL